MHVQYCTPEDIDFSISEFPTFFRECRNLMIEKLKEVVGWQKVVPTTDKLEESSRKED